MLLCVSVSDFMSRGRWRVRGKSARIDLTWRVKALDVGSNFLSLASLLTTLNVIIKCLHTGDASDADTHTNFLIALVIGFSFSPSLSLFPSLSRDVTEGTLTVKLNADGRIKGDTHTNGCHV